MSYPMNKLWGGLPTEKNMELAERYPHFYANRDHVLVISTEKPDGLVEISGELEDALDPQDWRWLIEERDVLLKEQKREYEAEIGKMGNEFLDKFEAELKARREMTANG